MSALQSLPKLQFAITPTPNREVGLPGELKWLALSALFIDPAYQRAILDSGKANIRRMIEGFSWLQFGTLVVGKRDGGRYALIDGQHRAIAAFLHGGIDKVPCLILEGGLEAEARAFSSINGNVTRIHPLQSFRASVAAGDSDAVSLVDICRRAGVTIAPYPKPDLGPGETMALNTLRNAAKKHGGPKLVAALEILRTIDPDSGLPASAVIGSIAMISEGGIGTTDAKKGAGYIGKRGPGQIAKLVDQAKTRKLTRGGAEWVNFCAVLVSALGTALRTGGQDMSRLMGGR